MATKKNGHDQLWERRKQQAIGLGVGWVKAMLQDHEEPKRAGVLKGLPIGFSKKKRRAAFLNILSPLLQFKEIARMSGVSPAVLLVWRTQKNFQDVEKQACKVFGEWMRNTIQIWIEEITEESLKPKPYLKLTSPISAIESNSDIFLINTLPFLNPTVAKPTLNMFDEKRNDSRYISMLFILTESLYLYRDKNIIKWIKSPTYVSYIKGQVGFLFLALVYFMNKLSDKKSLDPVVRNLLNNLKKDSNMITSLQDQILKAIDILAK